MLIYIKSGNLYHKFEAKPGHFNSTQCNSQKSKVVCLNIEENVT
jgi:hypothetical protein